MERPPRLRQERAIRLAERRWEPSGHEGAGAGAGRPRPRTDRTLWRRQPSSKSAIDLCAPAYRFCHSRHYKVRKSKFKPA